MSRYRCIAGWTTASFLLILGSPGCRRASATAEPAASASVVASANAPRQIAAAAPAAPAGLDVQSMFRNESEHRPGAALRAEDVLAALEKRTDARFLEARQHLAQPFRARYCKGAKVAHELAISICEYDDAAAAKAGREVSLRSLASIPDRQIAVNGATTLTLRQTKKTAASAELADRLVTAFAELKK